MVQLLFLLPVILFSRTNISVLSFLLLLYTNLLWSLLALDAVLKNGENSQIITHARNLDNPELCYVSTVIRILARAQRLDIKSECLIIVAMAGKKKLSPYFITSTSVASHSQAAAKVVHHISSKKDLARFSTHSFRVGACVLLHIMENFQSILKSAYAGVQVLIKIIFVT